MKWENGTFLRLAKRTKETIRASSKNEKGITVVKILRAFGSFVATLCKSDKVERLYQAEGLPKNISIEEFFASKASRAKFKYALEQGKGEEAEYFLRLIGILYELEEEYLLRLLTPEQIRQERQDAKTAKIVQQLRIRLDKLLADTGGMRGDLMQKVLNYLKSFWNQFFLYLKDGRHNIDNSFAERMLRPMTIEHKRSISDRLLPKGRKNSLDFGSHAGVEISVIYHTFIETCKMCGVFTLEYFKEFFKAIMQGRTDYDNMLPMTIGIKNNKV